MLDKLESQLKTQNFSQKTIDSYMLHNQQFLKFANKEPDKLDDNDLKNYLNYLGNEKKYKPRSLNLTFAALKFYFSNVLNKKVSDVKLQKPEKKSQVNLTKEELKSLVNVLENPKHKLLLKLMASSGLKAGEVITVKISDINFEQKLLKVKNEKGKEHLTIISDKTASELKDFIGKRKDANPYLFAIKDRHVSIKLPQKIIKAAAKKANINKKVFCHALRSSFSNILSNNGYATRYVKLLLGNHNSLIEDPYTKLSIDEIKKLKNPFEDI